MDYMEQIQKSLVYMEANLSSILSLDELAKQAHLSPYYFHRIFKAVTGLSVMEHIRKRRLNQAASDLLNTEISIMDITMKHRFNSQDVFTRAFKRYYGVTPGKYRNLNRRTACKNEIKEENYIMLNLELSKRLSMSKEDKAACFELLGTILKLSEKARKHGLLSLESDMGKDQPFLLNKALELLVGGVEPNTIKIILYNYIYSGDYQGKDLLERLLIAEGVLYIQAGESPILIGEKLTSFFGEEFAGEIDNYAGSKPESADAKIHTYIESVKTANPLSQLTSLLELPVQKLDDRSLQRLLRDIDAGELILALKGASGRVQERILGNLPKKIALIIVEDLIVLKTTAPYQIAECQNKFLEVMGRLRAEHEIS